jgi:hypothetical protein
MKAEILKLRSLKMKRLMIAMAVLMISGCLGAGVLNAQATKPDTKGPNVAPQKGKEGSAKAVSLLSQASELVRYARENESPLEMLTAIQMIERVQVQESTDRTKPEAKQSATPVKEGKKGETVAATLDPQKLLAEAKPWAEGDVHMKALIDAEAAKARPANNGTLGATGGANMRFDRIGAGYTQTWAVTFRAGEVARVAVIGDGDTDLDIYIYDENGNLITKDDDATDNCVVAFTPYWTSQFRVVIINRGNVYNNYMLLTN